MRILRVAQACYPEVAGGGAYHVHSLSRDQAAAGHDVTVLTVRRDPDRPHVEERAGYAVVRFDRTVAPLGNELAAGAVRYLREADGFDVVHAHSHLYLSTNVAALERLLGETPLSITNHGLYSQTAPPAVFAAYLRTLGRWTLDRADLVFCYTDVDERRLRELGVGTDVAVVPNGIDTGRFRPDGPGDARIGAADARTEAADTLIETAASRSETADARVEAVDARVDGGGGRTEAEAGHGDGPAILFVGRLVEGKRPRTAVAAVRRLRRTHPDARLYLCGEGPLRGALEDPAVTRLGQVPYDDMPAVYRSGDALVLPSRAEGLPRTVLEAMASGTPVVTSDLPHLRAVAEAGGTTARLDDPDAFAAALRSVLADPPEGGPAYVREHHRWADTVAATTAGLELTRRTQDT